VDVPADELQRRRQAWTAPPLKATRGTLAKYIRLVASASDGCVTDEA
jgi:dihydroxy-acid dehydratase